MVDTPLSSLVIHVKVLQVVVEVYRSSTEISTQEGSMGGEDGSDVDMPLSAERDSQTGLPFVEMGNNGSVCLSGRELMFSPRRRNARSSSPRPRTMPPCTQRRWSRWFRGRWVEMGYQPSSTNRPSTRPSCKSALESSPNQELTCCSRIQCRRGAPGVHPRSTIDRR